MIFGFISIIYLNGFYDFYQTYINCIFIIIFDDCYCIFLNEIIVYLYKIYYDIPEYEDLSNDFGLGMILFFCDFPVFFISIFSWIKIFMRRFKK